jgi:hypothetical protein
MKKKRNLSPFRGQSFSNDGIIYKINNINKNIRNRNLGDRYKDELNNIIQIAQAQKQIDQNISR